MATLVDTNVLGRRAQRRHPMHRAATASLDLLIDRQEPLYVAIQNLMEFWAVATRPAGVNGLGLTLEEAGLEIDDVEQAFELLTETADVYMTWRRLVREVGVSGRQVHDANHRGHDDHSRNHPYPHFQRSRLPPVSGITAIHPENVTAGEWRLSAGPRLHLRDIDDMVPGTLELKCASMDPDDDHILACVVDGRADYLVTADNGRLLSLAEFSSSREVLARFEQYGAGV